MYDSHRFQPSETTKREVVPVLVILVLKVIPPKQNLHSDFGKSLYTCNSIYVNPRNEIKRWVPTILLEIGGHKSTPLGLYILLRKAVRRNCTTILRNTKSDVQKSGNIQKG